MTRIKRLKREVRAAAAENGHELGRFAADPRYGRSVHNAFCGKCRAYGQVLAEPFSVDRAGNVLTCQCR